MRGTSILAPGVLICLLFATALYPSPWLFISVAAAMLAGLRLARRNVDTQSSPHPLATATFLSLVIYSTLASAVLLTIRAALGWLDQPILPFEQFPLPAYLQGSSLGFYDKSEQRLVLFEFIMFAVMLSVVFVQLVEYCELRWRRPLLLHPASATFAFILYFASIYLPPYQIDLDHWLPFIAAATGIRNGVWPFFSGLDSGYGLLAPAFLAVWLSGFGLSTLSLSAVIMASNLVTGTASFALMRKLTGSRPVALLGSAYLLLETASPDVVTGTFRAPLQITISALLLYASLSDGKSRWWADFLFGVAVLWNPSFGAFAATAFVLAHSYRMLFRPVPERIAHIKSIATMLAGSGLTLAAIRLISATADVHLSALFAAHNSVGSLFLLGYANLPQYFPPAVIPGLALAVLFLTLMIRRLCCSRKLTRRLLFVCATLVSAVPYVIYATGRSDTSHFYAAYWALMPPVVLFLYGFIRALALRQGLPPETRVAARSPARLSTTVLCVAFIALFPLDRLVIVIGTYTTAYEPSRQRWYADCAAGRVCDIDKKPTLKTYLQKARLPLDHNLLKFDRGLIAGCKRGIAILSYRDAWLYATADCLSPLNVPTVNLIITKGELDALVGQLASRQHVLFDPEFDTNYSRWKGDMLPAIKAQLIMRGFIESPGCGHFSVLSMRNSAPLAEKLCD
jgi:hypothetical protein